MSTWLNASKAKRRFFLLVALLLLGGRGGRGGLEKPRSLPRGRGREWRVGIVIYEGLVRSNAFLW